MKLPVVAIVLLLALPALADDYRPSSKRSVVTSCEDKTLLFTDIDKAGCDPNLTWNKATKSLFIGATELRDFIGFLGLFAGGAERARIGTQSGGGQVTVAGSGTDVGAFNIAPNTSSLNTPDIQIWRGGPDTWEQRRGTNPQTYRLYATFTDSANYERLSISAGTTHVIDSQAAGTGTVHPVSFQYGGTEVLQIPDATKVAVRSLSSDPISSTLTLLAGSLGGVEIRDSTGTKRYLWLSNSTGQTELWKTGDATQQTLTIGHADSGFSSSPVAIYFVTSGGTPTAKTDDPGASLGAIQKYAWVGGAVRQQAAILLAADATPTATSSPGRIEFYTTPAGSTSAQGRWRVSSNGHFSPLADVTYDIGASTTRVRTLYTQDVDVSRRVGNTANPVVIASSLAAPTSSAGDWWVQCTGTSPSRTCALNVNDGGTVRTIASTTF